MATLNGTSRNPDVDAFGDHSNGSYTRQSNGAGIPPKITLYTNHGCPYAHKAHIALKELDLPYEEVIIDLATPREPWYLKVNPRGLVPSIKISNGVIEDEIITESTIVAQFLADLRPSHLLPASLASPTAPLERARINFFVDTWYTKVNGFLFSVMKAEGAEQEEKIREWFGIIEKEIEPLLANASPFFNGNEKMTLAEVQVAPFILRMYELSDGKLFPTSVREAADRLPNFSRWAKTVIAQESVTYIWNKENVAQAMTKRLAKMRAQEK